MDVPRVEALMKVWTRAAVGLAATMMTVVLGVAQSAVAALPGSQLRATTVITGDNSAVMRVRLDRPATLDLTTVVDRNGRLRPAGVRIRGGELFPGFLLTRRSGPSASVMAFRSPHAMRERDDVSAIAAYGKVTGQSCTRCNLPAGDYDLYLVAHGQSLGVTLRLDGITGRSRLTPRAAVATRAYQAPPTNANMSAINPVGGGREQPGWVVGSYNVSTDTGVVPFAWIDARACLEGGREPQCREASLSGERDSVGGMHFAAHKIGDSKLESAVEWEPVLAGDTDVKVDHAMLMVPMQ